MRTRRERTHLAALRGVLAKLAGNAAIAADAGTCAMLLQLIGNTGARKLEAFATGHLRAGA